MPTTLVTGATGFVGSTMVDELLQQNHTLILAVRSPSSAQALLSNNPSWPSASITIIPVPDFTASGAFDEVFQKHPQIEYIVHVAAPMLDHPDNNDFEEHFEKPSVLGNLGLLKSAKSFGKNVKAVSVTGSMNAITTGDQEDIKSRVFTNKEWLPLGREDAIKANHNYVSFSNLCFILTCSGRTDVTDVLGFCKTSDLLLRWQEAGGKGYLAIRRRRETLLPDHKLHASSDLGTHAAAGCKCKED